MSVRIVAEQAYLESYLESVPAPAPLPVPNSTRSFWLDPDANPLAAEGSTGPLTESADVVIVGSGITGISAAYHLSKLLGERDRKSNIVIVEARDFCSGATGRNGGHLTPSAFLDFARNSSAVSSAAAVKTIALEHYTAASMVDIISKYSLADYVDLVKGNHLDLMFTDEEVDSARQDFEAAQAAGVDLSRVEWLSGDEMKDTFGTSFPAVRFPGHNIWPLKFVTKLYTLASSHSPDVSLSLHTRTPVTAISPATTNPHRWTVRTPRGDINTYYILHATNAYASHLLPHLSDAIVPTRGQIVAIREYGTRVGKHRMEGWGINDGSEYWFPRPRAPPTTSASEGEHNPLLILGGGREVTGPSFEIGIADDASVNPKVGGALRRFLPSVFNKNDSATGEWKVEEEWTGIMGFTKLGDPFVGPVLDVEGRNQIYEGQFIAAGYTGHGMPRAFACAEVAAQLISNDIQGSHRDDWEVPQWFPEHYLTWNRVPESKTV